MNTKAVEDVRPGGGAGFSCRDLGLKATSTPIHLPNRDNDYG